MSLCNNCLRKCNVDRKESFGICGVGSEFKIARAGLHFGEEPCITGKNGSGTIFFSGCSLKCVFCQNNDISHGAFGKTVSDERLVEIIKELELAGAENINFVTPTHYFDRIERILSYYRPKIPLICNTGGYELVSNIEKDLFDVYLFDLKFFSREKSARYASCADYFDKAYKALRRAVELKGRPIFDEQGRMTGGVIVRHLVLPQNTNESISIIDSIKDLAPYIVFSLMSQYVPMHKAFEYKELSRRITKREYNKVLNKCLEVDFFDIYTQSFSSATKEMIPNFDLSGV